MITVNKISFQDKETFDYIEVSLMADGARQEIWISVYPDNIRLSTSSGSKIAKALTRMHNWSRSRSGKEKINKAFKIDYPEIEE